MKEVLSKKGLTDEERLKNLAETLPGTMFSVVCDSHGWMTFEYLNSAAETLHGMASKGLCKGRNRLVLARMHPADRPGFLKQLQDGLQHPGVYSYEWRFFTDSGDIRWLRAIARAEHCSQGPVCWHGVALDVTEQKQVEIALDSRIRQQATIASFGQYALECKDILALKQRATELAAEILGVEYAKILDLNLQENQFYLVAGVGWQDGIVGCATVDTGVESQAGYTLVAQTPIIVEDLTTETRFSGPDLLHHHRVISGMSVIIGGPAHHILGVFGIHTTQRRQFIQDDVNFLQAMANILSAAIDRQRAETALRESEALNRAIFNALPDLIIRMDREGNYLNVKTTDTFPVLSQAKAGAKVWEVLPPESVDHRLEIARRALATGQIEVYEFLLDVDGKSLWQECRLMPLNSNEVLIVIRDLTEQQKAVDALRQSEARNRAILSAIPDTIALISADGIYLDSIRNDPVNDLIADNLDPVGKHLNDLLPPKIAQRKLAAVQHAIATGLPQRYEQQIVLRNVVQYEEVRVVACGEDAALVIIRNVSDRRELDHIKDEFISIVSHELRTPLTAIRGSLGLLTSQVLDNDPAERETVLQIALNNSERLVCLINDILDLERLEASNVPLRMAPYAIVDLMKQAIESVQSIADAADIKLALIPCQAEVMVDSTAIVQTFTNLLSNAIKFSPSGSQVWLEVRELKPEQAGGKCSEKTILVSVTDQGRGIPAENLETIFERFQQVDVTDARQRGGTGLGLAICKSIIQQHGGRIWVTSQVGVGSTFYFTLPRVINRHD